MADTQEQMQDILKRMEERDAATPENRERDIEMLKETASDVAETFTPYGDYLTGKEAVEDFKRGDYGSAALGAAATAVGLIPGVGDVAAKAFKKTRKAYKLFVKGEDGELYPLFVNADIPVKQGEFLEADFPDVSFKGKRKEGSEEKYYVPTKGAKRPPTKYYLDDIEITKKEYDSLGPNAKKFAKVVKGEKAKSTGDPVIIPDEETRQNLIEKGFITNRTKRTEEAPFGKVTAVAARPGHHASQSPVATHLGPQDLKVNKTEVKKLLDAGITPEAIKKRGDQFYVKRRAEDHVYAEVEMADDVDYQSMLAKEGKSDINDYVPRGGSYKYSDGQADSDQWVVGGDMKVNKVLSREEARKLQNEMGVVDLPYRDEVEAILERKFLKGGAVMDDYLVGKMMDEEPSQKFAEGGTAVPMKQQMSVFEDGGLMDQGGTVDPVSGNDVPTGSMQKEVRDDIPAQISVGEYVIPADVVRFYGIKFFEELRMGAKEGMQLLKAKGQVGNGDEQVVPDDVPFEMADLVLGNDDDEEGMEFNPGGFVNPYGIYQQPQVPVVTVPSAFQAQAAPQVTSQQQYDAKPVFPAQAVQQQVGQRRPVFSAQDLFPKTQKETTKKEEDPVEETKVETTQVLDDGLGDGGQQSTADKAESDQFDRDLALSSIEAGIDGLSVKDGKLSFDSKFDLGVLGTVGGFLPGPIGTGIGMAGAIGKGSLSSGLTAIGSTLSEVYGYNATGIDNVAGSVGGVVGLVQSGLNSDYSKEVEKGLAAMAAAQNITIEEAYAQVAKTARTRAISLAGDPTGGLGGGYNPDPTGTGVSGYVDPATGAVSGFGPAGAFAELANTNPMQAQAVLDNMDPLTAALANKPEMQAMVDAALEAEKDSDYGGMVTTDPTTGKFDTPIDEPGYEIDTDTDTDGSGSSDSPGAEASDPGGAPGGDASGVLNKGGFISKRKMRRQKAKDKRKGLATRK